VIHDTHGIDLALVCNTNRWQWKGLKPHSDSELAAIRVYVQSGAPLGSIDFRVAIATTLSVKVGKVRSGRVGSTRA